jgi:hypothetical protein
MSVQFILGHKRLNIFHFINVNRKEKETVNINIILIFLSLTHKWIVQKKMSANKTYNRGTKGFINLAT